MPMTLRSLRFPVLALVSAAARRVRADLVAGITVGLVLVPQSMAYAQLAGLPRVLRSLRRVAAGPGRRAVGLVATARHRAGGDGFAADRRHARAVRRARHRPIHRARDRAGADGRASFS